MPDTLKFLVTGGIALFSCLSALTAAGCVPATTTPLTTISFTRGGDSAHPLLLVFLPGRGDGGASYDAEGFVAAVRRAGIPADMMAVDAHMGYYLERILPTRLHHDIITPAQRQGYREIWLIGISLGGFGALWYDIEHPGDLAGVVALAPYLGDPDVIGEVVRAGGLAAWQPPPDEVLDDQHKIWRGLKAYQGREKTMARLYLGYGRQDKFAEADGLLAAVLPSDQLFTIKGGHNWATWRILWDEILKKSALAQSRQGSRAEQP
jgi:pimeloyl-ACP methyl ester carboxylesterase